VGQHIVTWITDFLSAVGYPGIFFLMLVEGFGVPVPSELTMPFSGFLTTAAGHFKFGLPFVIGAGASGEVAGGIAAYYVGYKGGRPALERYGRFVLVSPAELDRAERLFERHGSWIILGTRLLPAIRGFVAFPAGVARMPFWQFLTYGAIGSLAWCTALALVGHVLGGNWTTVRSSIDKYDVYVVGAVALLIAFGIYKRLTAGRGESQPADTVTPEQ
jgi:membrane protein DedA with SNARE-associated domain